MLRGAVASRIITDHVGLCVLQVIESGYLKMAEMDSNWNRTIMEPQ
jgi:hypothetical protein